MEVSENSVSERHSSQRSYNSHAVPRAGRIFASGRDTGLRDLWLAVFLVILDCRHAEDDLVHDWRSLAGDHMHGNSRQGQD